MSSEPTYRIQVRTEIDAGAAGSAGKVEELVVSKALHDDATNGRITGQAFWRRYFRERHEIEIR